MLHLWCCFFRITRKGRYVLGAAYCVYVKLSCVTHELKSKKTRETELKKGGLLERESD